MDDTEASDPAPLNVVERTIRTDDGAELATVSTGPPQSSCCAGVLSAAASPACSSDPTPLLTSSTARRSESEARRLTAVLPRAELRVERGAGHFLVSERPDAFVAAVRDLHAGACPDATTARHSHPEVR